MVVFGASVLYRTIKSFIAEGLRMEFVQVYKGPQKDLGMTGTQTL